MNEKAPVSDERVHSYNADAQQRFLIDEPSPLRLVNVLLKHRVWVVGLPVVTLILTLIVALFLPNTYTSAGMFVPQSGDASSSGALSSIAAQFGVALPRPSSGASPQMYAALLRSRTILSPLADSLFTPAGGAERKKLDQILDVDGGTERERRDLVVRKLGEVIDARVDLATGAVNFAVTTRSGSLSYQLAEALLKQVEDFNLQSRRGRAAAERSFMEERLISSLDDLRAEEARLETFLARNRLYQNDPQLSLEYQRLARNVRIREQVYTSLAANLEQVSIESSRTTPMISTVEVPQLPVFHDPKPLLLYAVLAVFAGVALGIAGGFAREGIRKVKRQEPDVFEEFRSLTERVIFEVRHPLLALRSGIAKKL